MDRSEKKVWTIGHSTRSLESFLEMLQVAQIELLVDVRSYPGSRKYPQYNKAELEHSMPANGIQYVHMPALGGRRRPLPNSTNTIWRNENFRGYADYMETEAFKQAVRELEDHGRRVRTAYMCSEAVWWRCHRSLISDFLKANGWTVLHIMDRDKATEHPYTKPAREALDNEARDTH